MIDINLVPVHLRRRKKTFTVASRIPTLPKEAFVGLVGGLLILLFVIHVILQLIIFMNYASHGKYTRQWEKILPEKQTVDGVLAELRALQNEITSIEKITPPQRILWAQKLNDVSDSLPRGIWINKISLREKVLFIDGSAVSKSKDEMISVGNFASNLKVRKSFMEGLQNIEVSSIQRRHISSTEVADFVITVKLQ